MLTLGSERVTECEPRRSKQRVYGSGLTKVLPRQVIVLYEMVITSYSKPRNLQWYSSEGEKEDQLVHYLFIETLQK